LRVHYAPAAAIVARAGRPTEPMMVNVFNPSLALLTDLYQLTMAYGYWKTGLADREAVFHVTFRRGPFDGQYAVACGLAAAIDFLKKIQFGDGDLAYLAQLQGNDGKPLFDRAFLVHLRRMRFTLDVDAIPEGTVVFGHEPLIRIKGPLIQAQIVETALLNLVNFQTLIATKSARICYAAKGDPVLEFGLRRAQGIDGAISASRAAYVGGCDATSNVLAGKLFNIPVRGTHAHSWVMCFDSELEAFEAYAKAMPNNCVFLVDTYNTHEGVRHAIEVGRAMRQRGHEMVGIRLDSGDLAYLSIEARRMLDAAGFPNAKILASNDLDERLIADLKQQGATIGVWGVGTKLVTAFDQPALGGVYKLSALKDASGKWQHKVKLSEQTAKVSIPGIQQVRRFRAARDNQFIADAIYDTLAGIDESAAVSIVDPNDMTRRKHVEPGTPFEDLLVPIFRDGKCVYDQPPLAQVRQRTLDQLAALHPTVKRFTNPHRYPAGLEKKLFDLRTELILKARQIPASEVSRLEAEAFTAAANAEPTNGSQAPAQPADEPPVNAEPSPPPPPPSAPSTPAPAQPPKKPEVHVPPRPKFAGIGAKHGQLPPGSNVRVNPRQQNKPPFFPRGGGGHGGGKR
jgi:nicotinate phosphoribosyltransferase